VKNALWENIFRNWKKDESEEALALKNVPVFEDLAPKEIGAMEKLVHKRTYKPDEFVFRKNAPGEGLYIILTGKVDIVTEDENGSQSIVASLKEGDFFGDLALLDEAPRSASAIAKDHSTLLGFFRPDLNALIKRNPQLSVKIILNLASVIGERLRNTNELLAKVTKSNS